MTFSVPEALARRFLRLVPARERSRYVAVTLEEALAKREAELVEACRLANEDPEVLRIEQEMDALQDAITEPWDDAPAR